MTTLHTIGLWGASGTGKTTFLSVLGLAAAAKGWAISGTGDQAKIANDFLTEQMSQLDQEHTFFQGTEISTPLCWRFTAPPGTEPGIPRTFNVTIWDVPGGWFGTSNHNEAFVDYLAGCQGLIYLFDPINDLLLGNAYQHTEPLLRELATRRSGGVDGEGALPHHVAVCVTKFDHPHFFDEVRRAGWGTQADAADDAFRMPRVKNQHAAAFYDWLCHRPGASESSAARVRKTLTTWFPGRVSYFVTSAVGFRVGENGVFDSLGEHSNFRQGVSRQIDGSGRQGTSDGLYESPRPINVLEPILSLARSIEASSTPAAVKGVGRP